MLLSFPGASWEPEVVAPWIQSGFALKDCPESPTRSARRLTPAYDKLFANVFANLSFLHSALDRASRSRQVRATL